MMRSDLNRIVIIAALSVLVGLMIGHVFLGLSLGLAWLLFDQYRDLSHFLLWMKNPKDVDPPDATGIVDELYRAAETRRKRNKARKKQLTRYLKRFKKATAALPDATVILGIDNDIQWGNRPARSLLGIRWPQDSGQRIENLIRNPQINDILHDTNSDEQHLQICSPVDSDVELQVHIIPYGKSQRLFIARDITVMSRAQRMRSDFVANVSHELRTPLTILRGYVESLLDNESLAHLSRQLGSMDDQTRRMQDIVNDLLLLSRLEQHDRIAHSNHVAVAEMLGRIHREAQTLSGEKNHLFSLQADADVKILGNESELYSAFSNLVTNAVKYTPERGVISINWYRDEDGAHMQVKDTGHGIPAIHLPRLTERFYRVDRGRSRSEGGTGLGLAIVKHVMNRHGASLHIESEPGKGSTFRCDFPATKIVADIQENKTSRGSEQGG